MKVRRRRQAAAIVWWMVVVSRWWSVWWYITRNKGTKLVFSPISNLPRGHLGDKLSHNHRIVRSKFEAPPRYFMHLSRGSESMRGHNMDRGTKRPPKPLVSRHICFHVYIFPLPRVHIPILETPHKQQTTNTIPQYFIFHVQLIQPPTNRILSTFNSSGK